MGNVLKGINSLIDVTSKLATIGVTAAIAKPYIEPTVSKWIAQGKYKLAYKAHRKYAVRSELKLNELCNNLLAKQKDYTEVSGEIQDFVEHSKHVGTIDDDNSVGYTDTLYQYLHIVSQLLLDVDAITDDVLVCQGVYSSTASNELFSWPSRYLCRIYTQTASGLMDSIGNNLFIKLQKLLVQLSNVYAGTLLDKQPDSPSAQELRRIAKQLNDKLTISGTNENPSAVIAYAKHFAGNRDQENLAKLGIKSDTEYQPKRMSVSDVPIP